MLKGHNSKYDNYNVWTYFVMNSPCRCDKSQFICKFSEIMQHLFLDFYSMDLIHKSPSIALICNLHCNNFFSNSFQTIWIVKISLIYHWDLKKQGDSRKCSILIAFTLLWHVALTRTPPHHSLPAFLNLKGIYIELKKLFLENISA